MTLKEYWELLQKAEEREKQQTHSGISMIYWKLHNIGPLGRLILWLKVKIIAKRNEKHSMLKGLEIHKTLNNIIYKDGHT